MIESLATLRGLMRHDGAVRILAKKLAPNDNSKNQIYLGGDFSALTIIPFGEVRADSSDLAGSVRNRAKAKIKFFWIDENGRYAAPHAQLILYPKYPEIRMSGLLKGLGSHRLPSKIIGVREEGRVLFLGITKDGTVLGYAAKSESPLARSTYALTGAEQIGVFLEIPNEPASGTSRRQLLSALSAIYRKHWIDSQKLGSDGVARPYKARNGGGYTLEAELGVSPNGYSEPDYLGWEIKQFGVADFDQFRPKNPVTLLTPEPTGGFYRQNGVQAFVRQYGYRDKSGKANRLNFGGIYACNRPHHPDSGLRLVLDGFDVGLGKITDLNGGIALVDKNGETAAFWKLTGIIEHWNRKHAQAAYVPSLFRTPPPQYKFGPRIQLCEETDLALFLQAVASGQIYYDPGIKLEGADRANPSVKRRSQFRIKHSQLDNIYHKVEYVDLEV